MQGLIKIGDNSLTRAIEQKYNLSPQDAVEWWKLMLVNHRLARTMVEAAVIYERKSLAMWRDGEVVETRENWKKCGGLEQYHFLFIELPGSPDPSLHADRRETKPPWDDTPPKILGRSTYRFPYWNYLSATELARVRDRNDNYQPFLHTCFTMSDLERVIG